MEVISIIPKTEEKNEAGEVIKVNEQQYILKATEKEIDKVSGISEVAHIAGRIQVGHEITVSKVYDRLDNFARNENKLKKAEAALREMADSIKNILSN